jgi:hypothetical protein
LPVFGVGGDGWELAVYSLVKKHFIAGSGLKPTNMSLIRWLAGL